MNGSFPPVSTGVKTSIDLRDSLHRKAKARATEQGVSLDEVLVAALEKGLDPAHGPARHPDLPAKLLARGSQAVDVIPV